MFTRRIKMKKNKNVKSTFFMYIKKVWKYMNNCRWQLFGFAMVSIIEAVIGAILPIASARVILNITSGLVEQLILAALLVFILNGMQNLLFYFKGIFYKKIYQKTLLNLQIAVARETLKLEVKEVDNESSGLFIDRLNKDTQDISSMFMEYTYWLSYVISNIGVLLTIYILNKYLFIYSLITSVCIFLINRLRISKQFEVQKKVRKIHERKTGVTSELIRGIRDIKVLNANSAILAKTKEKIEDATFEETRIIKIKSKYNYYENNVKSISDFLFIITGCFLYSKLLLTIPIFIIIYNYQNRVKNLLSGVVQILEYNKKFVLASERIFEVIENDKFKKEKFGKQAIKKLDGRIEFLDVEFSYNGKRNVINKMNFKIKPNEKVAFVGRSGVGKTTIFNLITKLYSIDGGKILIDNYNLKNLNCDSIRNNISMITQDPYLFNFSIKDNLLLSREDASIDEIREACKMACIDDFIMSLPNKYDTIVGENGITFSGGQKQRLAIARALLKKTEIILFDEATSALDNETQTEIKEAIEKLDGKYTILIIAHRLSTIVDCDKIFVVDNGKILDCGNHIELMKRCKVYNELYNKELI